MLPKINPANTQAWKKLASHAAQMKEVQMKDLFAQDNNRFSNYAHCFNDLVIDFSKNIITKETIQLLAELATECRLKD